MPLFYQLKVAAKGQKDEQGTAINSTILSTMMAESKADIDNIGSFIMSVLVIGDTEDEVLNELAEVYNLSDPKDLMFIARAAKHRGAIEFSRKIADMVRELLDKGN
jgi:hypothetical protein